MSRRKNRALGERKALGERQRADRALRAYAPGGISRPAHDLDDKGFCRLCRLTPTADKPALPCVEIIP